MKLRKSPRRKLRYDVEKGRITGLEGVVRGELLVPGERYGDRSASCGSSSGKAGHARCASEGGKSNRSERVDDRVRAGYNGFKGN
jgi:hypothetical protein